MTLKHIGSFSVQEAENGYVITGNFPNKSARTMIVAEAGEIGRTIQSMMVAAAMEDPKPTPRAEAQTQASKAILGGPRNEYYVSDQLKQFMPDIKQSII